MFVGDPDELVIDNMIFLLCVGAGNVGELGCFGSSNKDKII